MSKTAATIVPLLALFLVFMIPAQPQDQAPKRKNPHPSSSTATLTCNSAETSTEITMYLNAVSVSAPTSLECIPALKGGSGKVSVKIDTSVDADAFQFDSVFYVGASGCVAASGPQPLGVVDCLGETLTVN